MNDIIRVGMAGFGVAGQFFHAPLLMADSRFALAKVYERTTAKAEERYAGVRTVHTFEELLTDDIDMVVLCTPNSTHIPLAKQALNAGKHVVVEKPLAATAAEAEELSELSRKKSLLCVAHQNRRYDGDFLTVRQLLASGKLGSVSSFISRFDRYRAGANPRPWRRVAAPGTDAFYDIGIHLIDQAYVLFGMPDEVYAELFTRKTESCGTDEFSVSLYYPNTCVTLSSTELAAGTEARFAIRGSRGTFIKYGKDTQERDLRAGKVPSAPDWGRDDTGNYGTLYTVDGSKINACKVETLHGNYPAFYDGVYKTLRENAPSPVPLEESVEVLRIMEAAVQSGQEGRRISLRSL